MNFNKWDNDDKQILPEDIMKEYYESVNSGKIDETAWYFELIRSIWVMRNMISKRCQK